MNQQRDDDKTPVIPTRKAPAEKTADGGGMTKYGVAPDELTKEAQHQPGEKLKEQQPKKP
jgi:hypothetical protein